MRKIEFDICGLCIKRIVPAAAILALFGATPARVGGDVVDFDNLSRGEVVTDQYESSHGLSIETVNFQQSFDLGITYDTSGAGFGRDKDLEGPSWSTGNLAAGDTLLGNLLIIAENNWDWNGDGLMDMPDDQAGSPAGEFRLSFSNAISEFGLDVVDFESNNLDSEMRFYDGGLAGTFLGSVKFSDFTDMGSVFFDPTVTFANNSANRISPIAASAFGAESFDAVVIGMAGSGGVDNLTYSQVPEPATLALLAAGGLALFMPRRRSSFSRA